MQIESLQLAFDALLFILIRRSWDFTMLDAVAIRLIEPAIQALARGVHRCGISANQLTILGFAIGLVAALLIAFHYFGWALLLILISRLFDALDGAVARLSQATDSGGFLDICLDFIFYASIPLAFAFANPLQNALATSVLLFCFIGTASSFLAFAIVAQKYNIKNAQLPKKSFYFLGGLTEATETLLFFIGACLLPQYFHYLAYGFAFLCSLTIWSRIYWGFTYLKAIEKHTSFFIPRKPS